MLLQCRASVESNRVSKGKSQVKISTQPQSSQGDSGPDTFSLPNLSHRIAMRLKGQLSYIHCHELLGERGRIYDIYINIILLEMLAAFGSFVQEQRGGAPIKQQRQEQPELLME